MRPGTARSLYRRMAPRQGQSPWSTQADVVRMDKSLGMFYRQRMVFKAQLSHLGKPRIGEAY